MMADKEIGVLTAASTLDGSEIFHGVQGGNSRQITTQAVANLAINATRKLISETITATSATDVTFSSIPATFRDLEIIISGRGNAAGVTAVNLAIQFNSDTGANYDYELFFRGGAAGMSDVSGVAQTSMIIGQLTGATAPADSPAVVTVFVPNYVGTTFNKQVHGKGFLKVSTAAAGQNVSSNGGEWRSTAAITAVKVFPASSTFVDGTLVSLHGLF